MMTGQPARVTPDEIAALLDQVRGLSAQSPLADRLAYHERKADLLSHIAATLGTAEARKVAVDAWDQVRALAASSGEAEVTP